MNLSGFSREIVRPDNGCIGIFGGEGSGKTNLCSTATEWAMERDQTPGWIVCDRKSRKTIKDYHDQRDLPLPYINTEDFISQKEALALATNTNYDKVRKTYDAVVDRLLEAIVMLASHSHINPIIEDSGTQIWDWMSYSHFGRKQDVGRARVWGPVKQDWTDMIDSLQHKLVLITLKAKNEWKNDSRTDEYTWDGPPHLGYCTTSIVRCNFDRNKQTDDVADKFSLDVVESQDNCGLAGVNGVLVGQSITLMSLMALLRPGE